MKKSVILMGIFFIGAVQAKTLYITHPASVMMRTEPNSQASVIVKLKTGFPVETINNKTKFGYAFVKTDKQETGWVRTKYLGESAAQKEQNIFVYALQKINRLTNFLRG